MEPGKISGEEIKQKVTAVEVVLIRQAFRDNGKKNWIKVNKRCPTAQQRMKSRSSGLVLRMRKPGDGTGTTHFNFYRLTTIYYLFDFSH